MGRHYDSAVHELMHYKVEGIDISQAAGIHTVRRFEDFWRYVVQAKVDIVQLVFDDALAFEFQVSGDLGGHEPYAGYERRLDIELFNRANSRMVGNLAKRLWEEEYVGVWCDDREGFELLVLILYCMFELGDCQAMLRKYVVGFERSGIFPLWLGSMMEKTRCGNRRDVPVFVFCYRRVFSDEELGCSFGESPSVDESSVCSICLL